MTTTYISCKLVKAFLSVPFVFTLARNCGFVPPGSVNVVLRLAIYHDVVMLQ